MNHAKLMLQTYPRPVQINMSVLADCIKACYDCAQSCTVGADAALGEEDLRKLSRGIRLCQDCADICETTARILSRQTDPDWKVVRKQLELCEVACRTCGQALINLGARREYFRECAEFCFACESACSGVSDVLPVEAGSFAMGRA